MDLAVPDSRRGPVEGGVPGVCTYLVYAALGTPPYPALLLPCPAVPPRVLCCTDTPWTHVPRVYTARAAQGAVLAPCPQ